MDKGYIAGMGMDENKFREIMTPLKTKNKDLPYFSADIDSGKLAFVLVINSPLISTSQMMELVTKNDKTGLVKLDPLTPKDFASIPDVSIPKEDAYLLVDIDRGKESLNITPKDAMVSILADNRSPLTIEEGIAIVTQYPDFLMRNNCFSLLASRHAGDKRVPAIWINAKNHPNLGWCWNGNPHTWLGSASCKRRIGT